MHELELYVVQNIYRMLNISQYYIVQKKSWICNTIIFTGLHYWGRIVSWWHRPLGAVRVRSGSILIIGCKCYSRYTCSQSNTRVTYLELCVKGIWWLFDCSQMWRHIKVGGIFCCCSRTFMYCELKIFLLSWCRCSNQTMSNYTKFTLKFSLGHILPLNCFMNIFNPNATHRFFGIRRCLHSTLNGMVVIYKQDLSSEKLLSPVISIPQNICFKCKC